MTDIEKQKLPKPNERYLKCLRQQLRVFNNLIRKVLCIENGY